MGRTTPIAEPSPTLGIVARDPLVARLPADLCTRAQFGEVEPTGEVGVNKAGTLIHGIRLLPRHARLREGMREFNRGAGVLPMLPEESVTHVPGLYPPRAAWSKAPFFMPAQPSVCTVVTL